jgi:NAD(P)H-dependent flavin oxidoreductase YrpB (nitropropane dioxygenase family)
MRTPLCDRLEIEFPIFAFSHCRDVVAAVSRAGGFGVLGALGFAPEQLETELRWIDEHAGGRPYGVDIVIPKRDPAQRGEEPAALEARLRAMIPERHRAFARQLLAEHGVPELPPGEAGRELTGWTQAVARGQVEVALRHARVRLVANALGTPPADLTREIQATGRLVAALAGTPRHAEAHRAAGVDVVIAQGTESAAHTGELTSLVLWPQVVAAVAPTPVLAAGGIGTGAHILAALALGAQGVWTGSLWLTVEEADLQPAQTERLLRASSADTVRSRSFTGKPNRMLRNAWTEAWERPDAPDPLPMPLQGMVTAEAMARARRYPDKSQDVAINSVGQIVGMLNEVRSCREQIQKLVEEYLEAVERIEALLPTEGSSAG